MSESTNILTSWWDADSNLSTTTTPNLAKIIKGNTKNLSVPYSFNKNCLAYIDHSLVGGRGIFAMENIEEGTLIERCPLVPLSLRSNDQKDQAIWTYCYTKPLCSCEDCKNHGFLFYMVLGFGMIYNHQDDNNAEMVFNHKDYYVDIKALKNISKDNEIFVYYGSSYFNSRPKIVVED